MMLKERDKKLLFYSWSYAILAAAVIYACFGCGALAWTQLAVYNSTTSTSAGAIEQIQSNTGMGSVTNITKIHYDLTNYWRNGDKTYTSGSSGSGYTADICNASSHKTGEAVISYGGMPINKAYGGSGGWVEMTFTWDHEIPNGESNTLFKHGGCSEAISTNEWAIANAGGTSVNGLYKMTIFCQGKGTCAGGYISYSGSDLPDAPVINDFTKDVTCYSPGEAIILESNVTGTVDDWLWEIYDDDDVQVWSSTDSVETIVDETFAPGLYQVQLYVENTGGNDFLSKEDWLNVTTAGGCLPLQNWSPFPTQTTIVPTQAVFPTLTQPPMTNINISGINDLIDNDPLGIGNRSQGYRSTVDYYAEGINSTIVGSIEAVFSPFSLIINGIATAISLFHDSFTALQSYTTVPLAITAIVINYMPWQIVTLITAGIAIDAIFIILLGR